MVDSFTGRPQEIVSSDGTQQRCYRCREFKPFDSFNRDRTCQTGRARICRECVAARRAENPNIAEDERGNRFRMRYGITIEQYDEMYDAQGGRCAICAKTPEGEPYGVLSVDHDHQTKAIRGLLCRACNLGLGKFEDEPDRLLAASAYLLRFTMNAIA